MSAIRLNPRLWIRAKEEIMKDGKRWNARKAQLAVKIYKKMGGKYSKSVSRSKTSLRKWTKEKWDYVSKGSKRYLPEIVRKKLTRGEKSAATRTKKKMGKNSKYPKSINKKMKRYGIY